MTRHTWWTWPLLVYGTIALLVADLVVLWLVLTRTCTVPYGGGNITRCVAGLSEEQVLAASVPAALALLAAQIWLFRRVRRR